MKPIFNQPKQIKTDEMVGNGSPNVTVVSQNQEPINDEIANKAVTELLNFKKLKTISRIKPEQVSNLVKLDLFAKTFKSSICSSLLTDILQLQISINGMGRKELVQLVQQRNDNILMERPASSKEIFR